jgi:hypothetical protein
VDLDLRKDIAEISETILSSDMSVVMEWEEVETLNLREKMYSGPWTCVPSVVVIFLALQTLGCWLNLFCSARSG